MVNYSISRELKLLIAHVMAYAYMAPAGKIELPWRVDLGGPQFVSGIINCNFPPK